MNEQAITPVRLPSFGDIPPVDAELLQKLVAAIEKRKGDKIVDELVVVNVEVWNVERNGADVTLSPRRASHKQWFFTDEYPVHARAARVRTLATEAYKFAEGVSQR